MQELSWGFSWEHGGHLGFEVSARVEGQEEEALKTIVSKSVRYSRSSEIYYGPKCDHKYINTRNFSLIKFTP